MWSILITNKCSMSFQVSRLPGLELTLKPSSVDSTLIEKPAPKEKGPFTIDART